MALKADLEAKQADCQSVEDICKLALQALEDPKDEDFAKELLDSAEGDCSFPKDYIAVAEVYLKMSNKESADEMYEEAEDACFEPMETAQLGYSIALHKGDKEKAKELLESAANDAKKINEILTISNYVNEALGDAELAKELLGKVEGQLKELKDYVNLAETIIKESGDKETAKEFFKKASKKVDGVEKTVEYAETIIKLFDDKELAASVLDEVVDDAQFTKEFVMLAKGFKALGNENKAKELMESGKEFAMTGEENIDLAVGYWTLFQDKETASEGYEKGLNDINDKGKLLEFAKSIAVEMGNTDLAKKYYERAESKMSGAKDLTMLAQAVVDDLKDKEYAKGIYERAEQSIEMPGDLMMLAGDIVQNLDDKAKAKEVYQNALSKIEKFALYLELFDNVIAKTDDKQFGKEILTIAQKEAESTPELLQVFKKAVEVLKDMDFAKSILERAEEVVTNLNEMKEVNATVKSQFPDDSEWAKRVDEKLDKREKNQDKYEAYQKRENVAKTFKELREIVEEMMAELDDKYYAQKLLGAGQDILDNGQLNVDNYKKLIQSVIKYLNDDEWIKDILDDLIKNKVKFFFDYCAVCRLAVEEMPDKQEGKKLAETYLKEFESKLDSSDIKTAYNYTDLAKSVFNILGNKEWSLDLLNKANSVKCDFFAYAYLGYLAGLFGDSQLKEKFFAQSVHGIEKASEFIMLGERLKSLDVESSEIRKLYEKGSSLTDPEDKLLWAEGITEIFEDKNWAEKAYKEIKPAFKTDDEKEVYEISRKITLEGKFW
jgi:tetratricopeptide (TPR) repeat protein